MEILSKNGCKSTLDMEKQSPAMEFLISKLIPQ